MRLFKKKEAAACCTGNQTAVELDVENADILILGSGCAKCGTLETAVHDAAAQLKLSVSIGHVKDVVQIASYGVMTTPALVIRGNVVSYGKVLTVDEIKAILEKELLSSYGG